MDNLKDFFYITTSEDKMLAKIHVTNHYESKKLSLNKKTIEKFFYQNEITHGIDRGAVATLTSNLAVSEFPLIIAKGTPVQHGIDGQIAYKLNISSQIQKTSDWNFRDVMRIPSVYLGQKLATYTLPTRGINGINVHGDVIRARLGKDVQVIAGKNVEHREKELTYYAMIEGQVSITNQMIQVYQTYEVNETLSMKVGNLDFIGSIIIRGDVPSGYAVKAGGDVKIFGIVEDAKIIAEGSIYISEGLAGLKTGTVEADQNIYIGYVNQGIVNANKDIYIENSIIHSECVAQRNLFCQRGNIVGGSLSAGKLIEAKNVGNRLSTQTKINLAPSEKEIDEEVLLINKKKALKSTLTKLDTIGKQLNTKENQRDAKVRVMILKQKNSRRKVIEELAQIDEDLNKLNSLFSSKKTAELIVNNNIYPNVFISFGKYEYQTEKTHNQVQFNLDNKEIIITSI